MQKKTESLSSITHNRGDTFLSPMMQSFAGARQLDRVQPSKVTIAPVPCRIRSVHPRRPLGELWLKPSIWSTLTQSKPLANSSCASDAWANLQLYLRLEMIPRKSPPEVVPLYLDPMDLAVEVTYNYLLSFDRKRMYRLAVSVRSGHFGNNKRSREARPGESKLSNTPIFTSRPLNGLEFIRGHMLGDRTLCDTIFSSGYLFCF